MASHVDNFQPSPPVLPAYTSLTTGTRSLFVVATGIAQIHVAFTEGGSPPRDATLPIPLRLWFSTMLLLSTLIAGIVLEIALSLNKNQGMSQRSWLAGDYTPSVLHGSGWNIPSILTELLTCDATRYALVSRSSFPKMIVSSSHYHSQSFTLGPVTSMLYSSLWIWTCASIYTLQVRHHLVSLVCSTVSYGILQPYVNMVNAPNHGESAERTIFLDYSQRK